MDFKLSRGDFEVSVFFQKCHFFMLYKKRPPVKVAPPLGAKFCFTVPILFSKARPVNQNLAF